MNITTFSYILAGCSVLTALLTQAIKQWYYNKEQDAPPNLIALINAFVIGGLGTAIVYIWLDIPWSLKNILVLVVMILLVWIGSMIGYMKVFETIQQYLKWKESIDKAKREAKLQEIESSSEDTKTNQ